MKHLLFTLSMPNPPTWNGKWSGEGISFTRVHSFKNREFELLPEKVIGNHYFNWSDGWCAVVTVKEITSKEKSKVLKKSQGFLGYDWMIKSILQYGKILKLGVY